MDNKEKNYIRATRRIISEIDKKDLIGVEDWDDLVKIIGRKTDLENQSNLYRVIMGYWDNKFKEDSDYTGKSIKDIINEIKSEQVIEEVKEEPVKGIKKDFIEALPRDDGLKAWRAYKDEFWRGKGLELTPEKIKYAGIHRKKEPEKYIKKFYGLTDEEARRKWEEFKYSEGM